MLEKKLLTKIHVRNSNILDADPVYHVIKLIDDEKLIAKYTPMKKSDLQGSIKAETTSNLSVELGGNMVNLDDLDELVSTIDTKTPAYGYLD
ncbi:hypothetical protein PIB30_016300 [Stylosanthes scabra]|uniref:Uncharacterized protein n=1 Tax=Stylosanthes scabra TaxID=79078 RepID=A0ABU6Q807_9FABA|nr:hypothetical protein [Stylosanthes scabra]